MTEKVTNAAHDKVHVPIFRDSQIFQKNSHMCLIYGEGRELIICDGSCYSEFHASIKSEGASDYNYSVNFSME